MVPHRVLGKRLIENPVERKIVEAERQLDWSRSVTFR